MYTITALLTIALAAFTTASPIEATTASTAAADATQDRTSNVHFWHGDTCNNSAGGANVVGSGSKRCVPVKNVRSISASGSGCTVRTWSGNDCKGSNFRVPDSGCHSVLYGSVSIDC
jgi:hypothetical protein